RAMDAVIVHSHSERDVAAGLFSGPIAVVPLPYFFPSDGAAPNRAFVEPTHTLLFLGFIRPYKGLDVLLEALTLSRSQPRLLVAGESWVDAARLQDQVRRLGLKDRVSLQLGYVDARDVPALFAETDAIVLPYRHGTGSQYPRMAHALGRPSI